ncbi:MAG: F-type H+-transporting ATPase subunit b [Myxococcota bacterium]|jgi:F-type H+-transporting ATPase subunit b
MYRYLPLLVLLFAPGVALASDGVPVQQLLFHAINLLILLGAIYYFGGGMIRDALKTRSHEIHTDLDHAQKAKTDARARFEELQARLDSLDGRIDEMKSKAAEDAEAEAEAIAQRAERDAALIADAAERSVRNETERARQLLRREAANLAVDLAGQQLKTRIGAAENAQLTRQFVHAVEADNG